MDACDGDEGCERIGQVLEILGEPAVASQPGEGSFDHPALWQHDEACHVIGAFDDFDAQTRNLGDGGIDLMGMVAGIGPDQLEPREAVPYPLDHQRCAIAVLNTRRMDYDTERKAFGINQRMDLAPFDLLAGVIAYATIMTAPFSADLTD